MISLKEFIAQAEKNKRAIAHFNVATIDMFHGIMEAALEVSRKYDLVVPVVIGVSEGERDYIGQDIFANMIKDYRDRNNYPVFSNADHTYSSERTKQAIDLGYDMVIYDGNKVAHQENVVATKDVVEYRNKMHRNTLVEAELGFIGSGSNIKDKVPDGVGEETMTNPQEALDFVNATSIDLLAPSVGNVHGMVKSGNPKLNINRVREVREVSGVPLVLHGGSGVSDEDFIASIQSGISMIHVSTELRRAYRETLDQTLSSNDTLAPYRYLQPSKDALKVVARRRLELFSMTHLLD